MGIRYQTWHLRDSSVSKHKKQLLLTQRKTKELEEGPKKHEATFTFVFMCQDVTPLHKGKGKSTIAHLLPYGVSFDMILNYR